MNILYVLNSGKPGGMEQHVLDLVSGMVARDHKVFVWCKSGPVLEQYKDAGATVITRSVKLDIDPFYIYRMYRFLRENKIDVIHSHELKASVNALLAGFFAGTGVRISHTHTPISEWKINPVKKMINIKVYSFLVNTLATREIALTESRKLVKSLEGIREEKLRVLPNGLDLTKFVCSEKEKKEFRLEISQRFGMAEPAFIFGNISRITKEKGHPVLIDAFAEFLDIASREDVDTSNIYLLIAGGGTLEDEMREKVKNLDLGDKIKITGVFSREDHKKFYAAFDAFLFPTFAEGFGIVLIEAMSLGLSTICSDLSVLQEVGGGSVMYFELGNSSDLARKMYDLYIRFDKFESLRQSAKTRVQDLYSIEKFVEKYEDFYRDLMEV